MASRLEQMHIVQVRVAVFDEVPDFPGKAGLGKQAAAGGGGIVSYLENLGQLHLWFAGAARDCREFLPVNESLLFRLGRFQQLRRQRSQDKPFGSGLSVDYAHRVASLAHRALAEHLAGYDEIGARLAHILFRLAQHIDTAVDARVHVLAVAVLRVFYDFEHFPRCVDGFKGYAELFRGGHCLGLARSARCAPAEERDKVQRLDLDALFLYDLYCEAAVQAARKQGHGLCHCNTPRRKTTK